MTPGGQINIAQKGDARLHLGEKSGAFAGAQGVVGTQTGSACCSQWRALLTGGYADVPAVDKSMFGFDAVGLAGGGRMPPRTGGVARGLVAGVQLALPMRLNRARELWQSDDYVGTAWQLVPDVTALAFWPVEGGDKAMNVEISVGLSFRVFITSSVLP